MIIPIFKTSKLKKLLQEKNKKNGEETLPRQ